MNAFHKLGLLGLLAVFAVCSAAQQTKTEIKSRAPEWTPPTSGSEMYLTYCAACHGKDAKGNGPAAPALKSAPPDLTTLAKRNGGKYPTLRVSSILQGKEDLAAHGNQEMPMWGPAFRAMSGSTDANVTMRITNLNRYLESLQEK